MLKREAVYPPFKAKVLSFERILKMYEKRIPERKNILTHKGYKNFEE